MKRTILILTLILSSFRLSAQDGRPVATAVYQDEQFLLDTSYNERENHMNYEFFANDSIILNPGFSRNSSFSHHYYTMDLTVDGFGIYPPSLGLQGGPNEADTGYVGAIGGTVDVSAMGGATYTIPIELPVGINGMQPSLALGYNSQGGNGLLGWKWDLAGLSSITRTGKTRYHDGAVGGVTLNDEADRFMLDGQRLILVQDYTDSIDFKTEQDGMAKIRAYVINQDGRVVVNNFKVWNPDGTILEYGFTQDSRIDPQNGDDNALCWLLNKVSDRNGNAIIYNYTELQSSGEFYIESIQYTENESLSIKPEFTVKFDYGRDENNHIEEKSDYDYGFVAGNIVQQKRLLKTITVEKSGGVELLKYALDYFGGSKYALKGYKSDKTYHRLIEVHIEKDGKALNPTRIKWEWDEKPAYQSNAAYMVNLDTTYLNNFVFVGDFNADGFSDVITVPYKETNANTYPAPVDMNVLLNTGNGSFAYFSSLSMNNANGNPLDTSLDWIHVIDINDDGYDDIVLQYYTQSPVLEDTYLMLYLNQEGTGFIPAWDNLLHQGIKFYLTFGDFFGVGKQDVLVFTYTRHNDLNFVDWPIVEPFYFIHYDNGECIHERIYANPMTANEMTVGDFDGDGKTEILLVDTTYSKVYQLDRNGGSLLLVEKQHCSDIKYVPELNLFAGDYNGDGKDDLLCYGNRPDNTSILDWFFMFSTGTGFQYRYTTTFLGLDMAPQEKLYTYSLNKVDTYSSFALFASDFDGDGLCDIAISRNAGTSSSLNIYSKFVYKERQYLNPYSLQYEYHGGLNALAVASIYGIRTRSQYLHVGNFYCKDNMSFLGNEVRSKDRVQHRVPVLCSLYSLHEYNSVTRITDGMGNEQRLGYGYTAEVNTAQTEMGPGMDRVNLPIRTLRSVAEYKANNAVYSNHYSFNDAVLHKDGHGYLGFMKQEVESQVNHEPVGRRSTTYEIGTMGIHAFSLPKNETEQVYLGGEWRTSLKRDIEFRKVTCSRNQKVVKPAMTWQTTAFYNFDTPDPEDLLRQEIKEYEYSISAGGTYSNAYNCTVTRTGVNAQSADSYDQCEFKSVDSVKFYQDNYQTWTINRPHRRLVVQSRSGKPDVSRRWSYEFTALDSYLLSRVYENPMDIYHNPLMTQTDFEYYPEGNLKKQTLKAPHGALGEQNRIVEYEYGPGEGDENRCRLVTKKIVSGGGLSYETRYTYDTYDNIDTLIASNGLATKHETSPLGIYSKVINPDQTQSCDALRWVGEGDEHAPAGALYLKWSRSSGEPKSLTYYSKEGDELRCVSFGLQGEAVYVDKTYDTRGRLEQVSNPYHPGETVQWTEYMYDNLDRLTKTVTPDETVTNIEYQGLQTTTTVIPTDGVPQCSTVTANAMGWTVRSDDASGNSYVTYDHYADGLLSEAMVNSDTTTAITATYDDARNRQSLTDPNYGELTTTYNAYGELRKRVSPKEQEVEQETVYQYDGMGRLLCELNRMEDTYTRYVYDEEEGPTKGTLKQMRHHTLDYHNIQRIDYEYDGLARNVKTTETRPSGIYETTTEYDEFSRVSRTVFPTGVTVNYGYRNGRLQTVYDAGYNVLWQTDAVNAFGQLTDATLGNGSTTRRTYKEDMHYVDSIVTSNNLQNLSYGYDKFGNLASRKDNLRNLEETFHYDKMNRLTDIYLGNTHSQIVYDPLGRMTDKQADGQTVFANACFAGVSGQPVRPHAMKSAETEEGVFPAAAQVVTYTAFDKVRTISEGDDTLAYTYGHDRQRIRMAETVGGLTRTKDYAGVCEFITCDDGNGNTLSETLTYLVGPYGVFAVVEKQGDAETLHYILKDHLGSWTTITDANGQVEQELSFDAWGNLRDPETWCVDADIKPMFDRGFTGHEHITAFGLVNMNGRCYDPLTSSFLSVDAYVQDPTSAQSFNRYAYCMHNPLRYTDPTGWLSGPGGRSDAPNLNYSHDETARWHSRDGDMLWGRTCHPCETGNPYWMTATSSGFMIGNAYVFSTASPKQIQAIRAYQDNPSLMTSKALEDMGIDVTIGCTLGSFNGIDGFRASVYSWTDATGQSFNAQIFEYLGGNENGHYITGNKPSSSFWNENLVIAEKLLSTGGLYTYLESVLHYSEPLGKWMDKQGARRPLSDNGGRYIGGKLKYGKAMSNKFTNAGRIFGGAGVILSAIEFSQCNTDEEMIICTLDMLIGGAGVANPSCFGLPSTIWFFGGKQVSIWYGKNVISPMIDEGINPGLMIYQPHK